MNNEVPEKIYHDPDIGNFGYEECEGDTVYIREDIVQDLVEALEIIKAKVCGDPNPNWHDADARFASRAFIADVADAALARVKEEK